MSRNPVRKATRQSTGKQLDTNKIDEMHDRIAQSATRITRGHTLSAIQSILDDNDVQLTAKKLSLLCPLSKSRIRFAVKGPRCQHLECLDLRSFLEYRTGRAFRECPFAGCRENVDVDTLRIDEYLNDILTETPAFMLEVQVQKDGSYTYADANAVADVKIEDETPFVLEEKLLLKNEPMQTEESTDAEVSVGLEGSVANSVHSSDSDESSQPMMEVGDGRPPTKKRFVCAKCGRSYERKGRYITHIAKLCGKEPSRWPCPQCSVVCDCKSHFEVHMRIHTGERPHRCSVCGAGFAQKSGMKKHMTMHTGERPFLCEHCPKQFRTAGMLRDHVRTHAGDRPFQCKICPKSFKQHSHMLDHMSCHSAAREFKCDRCNQSFKDKVHLKRHQRIHGPALLCSFQGCGHLAISPGALRRHETTHSDDRPFACPQCEMRFKVATDVKLHQRSHAPPQHKCTLCDYAAKSADTLKNHMSQHANSRQYRCDKCPAAYNVKSILMIHKKKHNPDAFIKCDICSYQTTSSTYMKHHLQTPKHLKNQRVTSNAGHEE